MEMVVMGYDEYCTDKEPESDECPFSHDYTAPCSKQRLPASTRPALESIPQSHH